MWLESISTIGGTGLAVLLGLYFLAVPMFELNSFFDTETMLWVVCDSTHSRRDDLWAVLELVVNVGHCALTIQN